MSPKFGWVGYVFCFLDGWVMTLCVSFGFLCLMVNVCRLVFFFFFSGRTRHTMCDGSSGVCSSYLVAFLSSCGKQPEGGIENRREVLSARRQEGKRVAGCKRIVFGGKKIIQIKGAHDGNVRISNGKIRASRRGHTKGGIYKRNYSE